MYMYFEHDVCIFLVSTPISFYTQYYEYSHVAVSYDIIIGEWQNKKKLFARTRNGYTQFW